MGASVGSVFVPGCGSRGLGLVVGQRGLDLVEFPQEGLLLLLGPVLLVYLSYP